MRNIGTPELILILAIVSVFGAVFVVVPYWFIFRKAGFHPALSILMMIPFAGIVMRFFLAFTEWPTSKKVDG
jgi:hypothetical protein